MRSIILTSLVVSIFAMALVGCAQKESVKSEEPVVPAVTVLPEQVPVIPAPEPSPPPPPPVPEQKTAEVPEKGLLEELAKVAVPPKPDKKVVLDTVHFDFDKSDLREPDRAVLDKNAGILMKESRVNVLVEGHCDERGSAEYNLALGERRALSAMKYLVILGVPATRLSIISYGEEKPVDPGHDEDAWARNRRAEFVITGM